MDELLSKKPLGLFFDLDGTISEIAPTPKDSYLYPGVKDLLERAREFAKVAIISGRTVNDSAAIVNVDEIIYIGCHGLEWGYGLHAKDKPTVISQAIPYIKPGKEILTEAEKLFSAEPGVIVEYKSVAGSVHYRTSKDPARSREKIIEFLKQANKTLDIPPFQITEGKMVIELTPPLQINKGTAIEKLKNEYNFQGILYAGDDQTDKDAFIEIKILKQQGITAYSILVENTETPTELYEYPDKIVPGVAEMVESLAFIISFFQKQK